MWHCDIRGGNAVENEWVGRLTALFIGYPMVLMLSDYSMKHWYTLTTALAHRIEYCWHV